MTRLGVARLLGQGSPVRRGYLAVIGGVGAGQLLALAMSPLIARFYPPQVYGPFVTFTAVALPLGTVAALRLESAIALPPRERDARAVAGLGLWATLVVTLATCALVLLRRDHVAALIGLPAGEADLLLWAPVLVLTTGAQIVLNQVAVRHRRYAVVARRAVLQSATTVACQVGLGLVGVGSVGLVAGLILGQTVACLALASSLRDHLPDVDLRRQGRQLVRAYRRFPTVLAPSGLVNNLGTQLPILLAGPLYGSHVVGWLGMSQRILVLPLSLFGLAIAQVFLGEFSAAHRADRTDLVPMFRSTSRQLLVVGSAVAVVVAVAAPWAFPWVLGESWARSGAYAQALAPMVMAQMVTVPLSSVSLVTGRLGLQAAWDVGRILLVALAILGARTVAPSDDLAMVWAVSIASTLSYVSLWFLLRVAVRRA
ncbi:MAG: oligosaccharide flippase family protein [Phycicoccus sp.]|nr:oligosaccharide flippase family protein [Phycicoccus sp.]